MSSVEELPSYKLFGEQAGNDVGAMFAVLIGSAVAAGGGIGGGGVFVPIYILILNYPPRFAAALSQATIFGGALVNLAMNLRKEHPIRPHRPITDFSTLLIFEPMLLVGTIIGVLLNVVFPDIFILILLAVVLTYATVRTVRKGFRLWKKETSEFAHAADHEVKSNPASAQASPEQGAVEIEMVPPPSKSDAASPPAADAAEAPPDETIEVSPAATASSAATSTASIAVVHADSGDSQADGSEDAPVDAPVDTVMSPSTDATQPASTDDNNNDGLGVADVTQLAKSCGVEPSQITSDKVELCREFIERESQSKKPLFIIAAIWVCVSAFALFRRLSPECSAGYWTLVFVPIPIMLVVSYFMTRHEYNYYQVKINSQCWTPAVGDIKLSGTFAKILKYPAIASIAGVLGGLLGIGGGMIVSPLLIELGVIPTVAAATSAMAVLITSSSAAFQFLLLGFLAWDYTLFFMFISVIGTFIGQTGVNYAVNKYGRVSVVVFAVALIMALAILLMMINGIINLIDGVSWVFNSAC